MRIQETHILRTLTNAGLFGLVRGREFVDLVVTQKSDGAFRSSCR